MSFFTISGRYETLSKLIHRRNVIISTILFFILVFGWKTGVRIFSDSKVRIASGVNGGVYFDMANLLSSYLRNKSGFDSQCIETSGSIENATLLKNQSCNMAIMQGGVDLDDTTVIIAPLFHEYIHVIVRSGSPIKRIKDLKGRSVMIGVNNSGMNQAATKLLQFHGITYRNTNLVQKHFSRFSNEPTVDAAIITAGFTNSDLIKLLESGNYEIIPVDFTEAFCMRNSFFKPVEIPRGLYKIGDHYLNENIKTIATPALLVGAMSLDTDVVDELLKYIFSEKTHKQFPFIFEKKSIPELGNFHLHKSSSQFFFPTDQIGVVANIMETLAAFKELAVTLALGIYILWNQRKDELKKLSEQQLVKDKEKLDKFLDETIRLENAVIKCSSRNELAQLGEEVTSLKLRALDELTNEALRGDNLFLIFMMQCSALLENIQKRMM